jgi:hypothetical protein
MSPHSADRLYQGDNETELDVEEKDCNRSCLEAFWKLAQNIGTTKMVCKEDCVRRVCSAGLPLGGGVC